MNQTGLVQQWIHNNKKRSRTPFQILSDYVDFDFKDYEEEEEEEWIDANSDLLEQIHHDENNDGFNVSEQIRNGDNDNAENEEFVIDSTNKNQMVLANISNCYGQVQIIQIAEPTDDHVIKITTLPQNAFDPNSTFMPDEIIHYFQSFDGKPLIPILTLAFNW